MCSFFSRFVDLKGDTSEYFKNVFLRKQKLKISFWITFDLCNRQTKNDLHLRDPRGILQKLFHLVFNFSPVLQQKKMLTWHFFLSKQIFQSVPMMQKMKWNMKVFGLLHRFLVLNYNSQCKYHVWASSSCNWTVFAWF